MEAGIRVGDALGERVGSASLPSVLSGRRVALVHDWLTGMRGGEKCLDVLCQAFPDATIHTLIHRKGAMSPTIERMKVETTPLQRLPGIFKHYRKFLPVMPMATRSWHVGDVDLVVSLSHCVAKAVQVPKGVPHVSYCFTPMRYAWEGRDVYLDSLVEKPLQMTLAKTLLGRMRKWDKASTAGVSQFVAISETVRERISRCYGRESRVIYPPVDTEFYTPDNRQRTESYLCVSAMVPYKRTEQAITACSILGRKLTVIGEGSERARLERIAGPGVKFLGWQPDEVIRDYYRSCKALLFPGEEDFGIVPVEAMACGAPVIGLGRGGLLETVDKYSGKTYTAPTAEGLMEAIEEWEARGCPHDPAHARSRAELFALPVFRDRLLGFLGTVLTRGEQDRVPPAPHVAV